MNENKIVYRIKSKFFKKVISQEIVRKETKKFVFFGQIKWLPMQRQSGHHERTCRLAKLLKFEPEIRQNIANYKIDNIPTDRR